jgi:hypothetical protein
MIVLAREVFLCKCSTHVPDDRGGPPFDARLRFVAGAAEHLELLDPEHHTGDHVEDFRGRLSRGEHWLLGLLGDRIVTYTWLHTRPRCSYPYLPGCDFGLADDYGYGYDAWTPPALRGGGLRRRAFVEELRVLASLGRAWEASFFVAHQLEGATRSLARTRVTIVPLWRVSLGRDRRLQAHRLDGRAADGAGTWFIPADE